MTPHQDKQSLIRITLDLSVIIVSWNVVDLLRDCLRSVESGAEGLACEVIVVDNASTDGSADMVRAEFPRTQLIANAQNLGYARANNQGLHVAKGRHVVLLNSDTLVPAQAMTRLVAYMDRHADVGAMSPRLALPDGTSQAYAFGDDPTLAYLLRRGINRLVFHRPLHDWDTTQVQTVDWVSGACLVVRSEAVAQAGLLDERFFMYFEDNDWCLRIRKAGWLVRYYPALEITHYGGQSLAKNPRALTAYGESLRYFYRKHYGPLSRGILAVGLWIYGILSRLQERS